MSRRWPTSGDDEERIMFCRIPPEIEKTRLFPTKTLGKLEIRKGGHLWPWSQKRPYLEVEKDPRGGETAQTKRRRTNAVFEHCLYLWTSKKWKITLKIRHLVKESETKREFGAMEKLMNCELHNTCLRSVKFDGIRIVVRVVAVRCLQHTTSRRYEQWERKKAESLSIVKIVARVWATMTNCCDAVHGGDESSPRRTSW